MEGKKHPEQELRRCKEKLKKLQREKRSLESLIHHSFLGIVTVDESLRITSCNQEFRKLFQYKKSEVVGRNLDEVIARERSFEEARKFSERTLKGNATHGTGIRYRKDGTPVTVEFFAVPAIVDGKVVGAYGIYQDISERVKISSALRESEARYRQLVEMSPLPIAVYDERSFYFGNIAFLKILKAKSKEDFIGKCAEDFVSPESLSLMRDRIKRILRGEFLPNVYEKLVTLEGDEIEIDAYSVPVTYQGKPAVMSIFSDVTEKRKAEALLRREQERYQRLYEEAKRQEELYRSLLNSSADAIVIYNLQGEAEFVSPSFTKIFGWLFDEIKGKRIPFVPESERMATEAVIKKLFTTRSPIHGFETRRLTRDGRLVDVSVSGSLYMDASGEPVGMLVVLRDVTEKVKAEKAIRDSEKRFRDLFNSVSDLIFTQDLEGRFLSVNRAIVDLFGYTPEEIIGRKGINFMKPELRLYYESEYLTSIREKGYHKGISVYYTKSGQKVYLENRSTLSHRETGEPYISGIARDVTEWVVSRRRIKKLQEEMLQVQKMEAIGTLAGGIAHDFNNLLMGIQGNISLLKLHTKVGTQNYERLKNMEDYIRNGSDLTMQLLGFARGGRYEVVPTNLNELIRKEVNLFGRTKKEIEMHLKLQEDLWVVEADQGQMGQVFLNLFVNAWQAMPKGGQIYVQTENLFVGEKLETLPTLEVGNYVKVTVSDTGVGMDEETRKRIFEPFFTTKGGDRGIGLGLASVYGIIENHGGVIQVESQVGMGATFTLYLPATEEIVHEEKSEVKEEIVTGMGRILLVDDEEKILKVGKQLLEVLGYEVASANRGEEAIEIFRSEKKGFDLVILDMIMPGMGGGEVFTALRKIVPDVKVLLASGYSIDGQASEIMAQGCDGFIQKPFTMERLSEKIKEILSG